MCLSCRGHLFCACFDRKCQPQDEAQVDGHDQTNKRPKRQTRSPFPKGHQGQPVLYVIPIFCWHTLDVPDDAKTNELLGACKTGSPWPLNVSESSCYQRWVLNSYDSSCNSLSLQQQAPCANFEACSYPSHLPRCGVCYLRNMCGLR